MINTETIKDKYRSMSDQQLRRILMDDFQYLTTEAKEVLQTELERRQISMNEYHNDDLDVEYHQNQLTNLPKELLYFILEKKEKGASDAYVIGGLFERGIEEETAIELLKELPSYVKSCIKEMRSMMLQGFLLLISGLAIRVLPLSKESHLAIIILANVMIGFGIIRIFHSQMNKKKMEKIYKEINC